MRQDNRTSRKMAPVRRWSVGIVCAVLWFLSSSLPALGHKVMIFAWVEGDTVYTQSKFSGGKRVKNGQILVFDLEGNQILEGQTDQEGEFSFTVPKKTGLKIILKASMGHLAEWTIPVEDMTAGAPDLEHGISGVGDEAPSEQPASPTGPETGREMVVPAADGLSRQEVKGLIDESLDRKLAPILRMLTESLDRGPRVTEVIGGIGYILGLAGVALYLANRQKRKSRTGDRERIGE